jgi:hypothetical protein
MRPPNTHYIREFINRGQNVVGNGLVFDKETIANVTRELTDVLAYVLQLENKNAELEEKLANSSVLEIELIGDKF